MIEFDERECIKAKEILAKNQFVTSVWRNNFSPSNVIGNCTNLYRKLNPENCEDFFKKYLEYAKTHKDLPINERGLTEEELVETAKSYYEKCNPYGFNTFLYDMICHIIVETYNGQQMESQFIKYLERLGYSCTKFDGAVDAKYGLDIKVSNEKNNNQKPFAVQIKPISFFISNRMDVERDRIRACYKYEDAKNELDIITYYAIYNRNKTNGEITWLKNNAGFSFKINELFQYDKNNIEGTFKRYTLTSNFEKLNI